ncbi:hypothetical protein D3C71_987690 [compost metagenome]
MQKYPPTLKRRFQHLNQFQFVFQDVKTALRSRPFKGCDEVFGIDSRSILSRSIVVEHLLHVHACCQHVERFKCLNRQAFIESFQSLFTTKLLDQIQAFLGYAKAQQYFIIQLEQRRYRRHISQL